MKTNNITSLQTVEQNQKAITFTEKQVELIKDTIAVEATDDELKLFLYQAQRTGLDPLARQIYFVKRGGKAVIQTSIDGFRVVAERSGNYAGQDEPEFEEDTVFPKICKVRVYKFSPSGERYQASVGVAYWSEYCPPEGQNFMWKKMPHTMLSKVAESLALRKGFPQDLSGLYTTEEMPEEDISETSSVSFHAIENNKDEEVMDSHQTVIQEPIGDVVDYGIYESWSKGKLMVEVMGLKRAGILHEETSVINKMTKEELMEILLTHDKKRVA